MFTYSSTRARVVASSGALAGVAGGTLTSIVTAVATKLPPAETTLAADEHCRSSCRLRRNSLRDSLLYDERPPPRLTSRRARTQSAAGAALAEREIERRARTKAFLVNISTRSYLRTGWVEGMNGVLCELDHE